MREDQYGLLVIDWKAKKAEWFGMDGGGVEMTPDEVLKEGAEHDGVKDVSVSYLIHWEDNGQLCVHDRHGFIAETEVTDDAD